MLWSGNAREGVALVNRPFCGRRAGGCIKLPDCTAGYDKEVVIGPEETSVEQRDYVYRDVHEHAAIAAVPDTNGFVGGYRDAIALRRVFRCYHGAVVGECEHLFAGCNVPDGGGAVERCHEESRRVGREIDGEDVVGIHPVRQDLFERLCVPHKRMAVECPPCDPPAILRNSETPHIPRVHRAHFLPVGHSPHSNLSVTTADDVLAIHCECHCLYFATDVDVDQRGTLFPNG